MKSTLTPLFVVTTRNGPHRLGAGRPKISVRNVADTSLSGPHDGVIEINGHASLRLYGHFYHDARAVSRLRGYRSVDGRAANWDRSPKPIDQPCYSFYLCPPPHMTQARSRMAGALLVMT